MSDLGTTTDPATPDAPAAPTTPADYEALYRNEVQERQKERNLFKPAQRMLNDLDESARAAVLQLAELAKAGDPDAIVEWALYQAEQVSGKDVASIVAARQAATDKANPDAVVDKPTPGLSREEVEEITRNITQTEARRAEGVRVINAQLEAAGYTPNSAPAKTIISYCVDNDLDLPDGIKWFNSDVELSALERAQRAAAAGADATGTPAPQGNQAGTLDDGMKEGEGPEEYSRRRAMSRMAKGSTS
jgi:hypothetical protein